MYILMSYIKIYLRLCGRKIGYPQAHTHISFGVELNISVLEIVKRELHVSCCLSSAWIQSPIEREKNKRKWILSMH